MTYVVSVEGGGCQCKLEQTTHSIRAGSGHVLSVMLL